jgi:nucleotide-binding universal stress UspA family protein
MAELKKIVVPTDFSSTSWNALDWVREYSKNTPVEVHCVFAMQQPTYFLPSESVPSPETIPTLSQLKSLSETSLTQAAKEQQSRFDQPLRTQVVIGKPADEIVRYAEDINADMIVMAARGRNALSRMLIGDTAASVVQLSTCPVVTIKEAVDDEITSETIYEELHSLREDLGRSRDALRDELILAKDEVREEWEELEEKWEDFNSHLKDAGSEAITVTGNVGTAISLLGEELKRGYRRIRDAL